MIAAGALLMIASHLVGLAGEPFEQITAQVAGIRVAQCGLGSVSIRFDEPSQSEILTVKTAYPASDKQLACAARAAGSFRLELPPAIRARYDAIRTETLSAAAFHP